MFLSASEKTALNLLALRLEHDLVEIGKLMPGSLKFCILRHIQLYTLFFTIYCSVWWVTPVTVNQSETSFFSSLLFNENFPENTLMYRIW